MTVTMEQQMDGMTHHHRPPVRRTIPGWRLLTSVAVMTAGILLGSGISAADVPAASPNPTPEVTDAQSAQSAQSPTTGPTLTEQDDLADPSQSHLYDTAGCRIG
jgi:hypothetical protein